MGSHEGWIDTLQAFKIYSTIVKYEKRFEHKQTLRNLSGLTLNVDNFFILHGRFLKSIWQKLIPGRFNFWCLVQYLCKIKITNRIT